MLHSKSLRFQMLKAWMVNPDLSSIDIEEKYQRYAEENRTDRYVTVSWWNLLNLKFTLYLYQICPGCNPECQIKHYILISLRLHCCSWRNNTGAARRPKPLSMNWWEVPWILKNLIYISGLQGAPLYSVMSDTPEHLIYNISFQGSGWNISAMSFCDFFFCQTLPGQKGTAHPQACSKLMKSEFVSDDLCITSAILLCRRRLARRQECLRFFGK